MRLDIMYENLELSFKRSTDNLYNMYINGKRNPFSAKIYNLVMKKYVIHYDLELNNTVAELLNDVSKTFLPKKTTTVQNNDRFVLMKLKDFILG